MACEVTLEAPETMNLLGLMLKSILDRNLANPRRAWIAGGLSGSIGVQAGQMKVTLHCDRGCFRISRDSSSSTHARVRGSLEAFLDIATGEALVRPVLKREVQIGGNPFLLLRLIPLLRVG